MTLISNAFKNDRDSGNGAAEVQSNGKEISGESEFILLLKSMFARELFPNNFDRWTTKEQYSWINKNLSKFYPNVPETLLKFLPAFFCDLDHDRSQIQLPEWFDIDKYRRGQEFIRKNYTAILMTLILGIIHTFTLNDILKPAIMTGLSHTPYLAFKRYLPTIHRFYSWFNGEPWVKGTPAYESMQCTRQIHLMIRKKLCKLDNEQIDNASIIAEPWCPDRELLLKDFAAACPFEKLGQRPYISYSKSPYRPKGINNGDMAVAQCAFISSLLLYPQDIGIHDATDEDLEAVCHMWRCYGYYLGIADEYNLCRGSLEEIKQRMRDVYQYWIIANFKDVTLEWEHMTRCFVETINYFPIIYMPYKVMILIATNVLNLNMPHLYASLSYLEWIAYKIWTFILRHVFKFSSLRAIFNEFSRKIIDEATKFSPEKHAELQEKSKKQLSNFSINNKRA